MKIMGLYLTLFLLTITIFGCEQNNEVKVEKTSLSTESLERITIDSMKGNSDTVIIEERESIENVKKALASAERQSGIVNMADPEFKIVIEEKTYFLWIDDKSGTIMDTEDTHTIYSLSEYSVKQINELLEFNR